MRIWDGVSGGVVGRKKSVCGFDGADSQGLVSVGERGGRGKKICRLGIILVGPQGLSICMYSLLLCIVLINKSREPWQS